MMSDVFVLCGSSYPNVISYISLLTFPLQSCPDMSKVYESYTLHMSMGSYNMTPREGIGWVFRKYFLGGTEEVWRNAKKPVFGLNLTKITLI